MNQGHDEVYVVSQYWTCFIDESGDLDKRDHVVLAGVLLPARDDHFLMPRLREVIKQEAPLVPWPFHRWIATKPSIYPLWYEQRREVELKPAVEDACRRALAVWEKERPELLRALRDRCNRREEPSPGQLGSLRKALKKADYAAFDELLRYSEKVCLRVAQEPSKLVGSTGVDRAGGLVMMVGQGPDEVDAGQKHYFELLVLLLERLRDILSLRDGEQSVTVDVASRYARHPDLPEKGGGRRPLKLTRNHVEKACERVVEEPKGDQLMPRIRVTTGSVSDYDKKVAPGVVIADGVANYLRRLLFRKPRLDDLHRRVQGYFGLPIRTDMPALSHVAATNAPARAVGFARRRKFDDAQRELEQLPWRWPREQAEQWVQFFEANGEKGS